MQPQQQQASSSRVLRSTEERRRRNNLFSNFYPLLSRNSSSNNNSNNNNDASPESNNNSNGSSSSGGRGTTDSPGPSNSASWPERPPSRSGAASPGVNTRSSNRSPAALQASPYSSPGASSSGRTPRGLSRVQRMQDEQSIRSTRSSSRASSFAAVSPPVFPPASSTANQPIEYMDIDPESVGVTAQHYQPPPQSQTRPVMRPSALSQSSLSSQSGLDAAAAEAQATTTTPTTFTAAPVRESGPRTRSATAAVSQEHFASSASSTSTTATGSDDNLLLSGLDNPRGDTSISSNLFPIRPDSDDDDDMDHDVAMDRDQQQPSAPPSAQPRRAHTHTQTQTHTHAHNHTHGRRFPGPEIFAQIMMSLHESAATASVTPPAPTATTGDTATASADGQQDEGSSTGTTRRPGISPLGRTRIRSSSMRGLFGYQPTNDLTDEERPANPEIGAEGTAGTDSDTSAPRAERPGDRFAHQIPLFIQLLAEISRMSRNPNEADPDQTEGADRPADTATAGVDGAQQHAHPDTTTAGPVLGTDPLAEPSTDAGATPRLRRPNTTIRLIQLGHGVRHPRPTGTPTGATATTAATGEEQAGTEGHESPPGPPAPGEGVSETFVMFLSPPEGLDDPESNDAAAPGNDDPESARNRARQRAPWVILTLSGAYLNSMMGAGGEGEGGSTYDDLWMLANMIGPARPITTTQEAIDNAGFAVGRFEQALQGMRNVTTLGDGSKCLVCMSEYEEGEDMRALKCNHGFHQECIDKWLTTGANKCPVCRTAAVVTETPVPEVSVNPSTSEE
ncbi:hypothetical protein F5H01DRAFT_350312 [Linnemannia elongata]|nr:hypothetical protein F5H01DRAFT_350312 [Linnemannia elongata]